MYVCLINIDSFLVKYYGNKTLIKDQVLRAKRKTIVTIHKYQKQKKDVITKTELICPYTQKNYTSKQKNLMKSELNYINDILTKWILN